MKGLDQYLVAYIISNVVGILFVVAAAKHTRLARLMFALLFLWASGTNMSIGLTSPETYQQYSSLALPFYRDFINGWFSHYNYIIIPLIAAGQFAIAIGMLLKGWWVKWACIGAIVFLLCIVPLMVGSGFPFPLVVSFAAWLVMKKDKKDFLWRKPMVSQMKLSH